jgi:hypothetical protein
MSYYDSLPPSFGKQVFVNEKGASLTGAKFGSSLDSVFQNPQFGVDTAGRFNSVANALTGLGALAPGSQQPAWTFITAPEDISWTTANQANRVDIFGTNNPPVVSGSRGMRDLTLGNALVEGFVRGKQVEDKVLALENLMNYSMNPGDGFVSVPVYQVWANKKGYGNKGYFVIKDVRVKEAMRDLTGKATRAYVDISLMQVPSYQVNSGRDQASTTTAGAKSGLLDATAQANQSITKPGTPAAQTPSAKPGGGPKGPVPQTTTPSAPKPPTSPAPRADVSVPIPIRPNTR